MSRLCMFHPVDAPMERGWPGRVDGEHAIQLAAQTLESFFTGGGTAREHAVYPLAEVRLLAPVLHPPAIRLFEEDGSFAFANPAAIAHPSTPVVRSGPRSTLSQGRLRVLPRVAAVVGAQGSIGGFTLLAEWRDPRREPPKDRDFALGLGPVVVTADELDPSGLHVHARVDRVLRLDAPWPPFDWEAARDHAAGGTTLRPGDLLASPPAGEVAVAPGNDLEIEVPGIGVLRQTLLRD